MDVDSLGSLGDWTFGTDAGLSRSLGDRGELPEVSGVIPWALCGRESRKRALSVLWVGFGRTIRFKPEADGMRGAVSTPRLVSLTGRLPSFHVGAKDEIGDVLEVHPLGEAR